MAELVLVAEDTARRLELRARNMTRSGLKQLKILSRTLTKTAINIVTKLGRDRAIRTGCEQDKSVNNAFKLISVTLQRCNADMFLNKYVSLDPYNIM